MGHTNLLHGLRTKYASLTGEAETLDARITQIKLEYTQLAEMEGNLKRLRDSAKKVASVIRLFDAEFREESVAPVKPYSRRLPIKTGDTSKTALDILRTAAEPMTAREIALEVLERHGITDADSKLRQATTNTVDSTLRAHQGRVLVHDDSWPKRWRPNR